MDYYTLTRAYLRGELTATQAAAAASARLRQLGLARGSMPLALAGARRRRRRTWADVAALGAVIGGNGGGAGGGWLGGGGGGGGGGNQHGGGLDSGGANNIVIRSNSDFEDMFADGLLDPWWTTARGSFSEGGGDCVVDAVEATGNPRACLIYNAIDFTDGEAAVVIGSAAGEHLVGVRVTDAGGGTLSGYFARASTLSTVLYEVTANVATSLTTAPTGYAIGDEIRLRATGTALVVEKNGVGVIAAADATHAGPGHAALGTFSLATRRFRAFRVRA